ncbi:MAG: A/G-specific adenine glycosylase [Flavobacteriaceae bacterium]
MFFSEKILNWYSKNKRVLPWRNTKEPYRIWLSEIMLQQTRVAQGVPYYLKFIEQFPKIQDLAAADEEEVLKLWQGLGYYSRARNLHSTARTIVNDYDGKFPENYEELICLKGIGDYTASAIASICFDKPEPVVDGNVYRVLSRYFGIDLAVNSAKGSKYFKGLAREIMDVENIRDYNQGIMEFGAVNCTPVNPKCGSCPLSERCVALAQNSVSILPVKIKKAKIKKRYFNYLVGLDANNKTQLVQRTENDIWKRLYEFPLLESLEELGTEEVLPRCRELLMVDDIEGIYENNSKSMIHNLSHQKLYTKFWIIKTRDHFSHGIPIDKLEKYPVPVLIADFIKTFKNSYF